MHDLARGGHLVELAREEHRTVEARIEGAVLVERAARDLDGAEHLVPACFGTHPHRVETALAQLPEVLESLLLGNERRGDARRDLLSARGREVHLRHGVLALDRLAAVGIEHVPPRLVTSRPVSQLHGRERRVEAHDEPVPEVVRHAAAVARGVADDRAVVRHADPRPPVEGVDHHPALVRFGEGEAHDGRTVGRCDLGLDVVVGQIDRIVVGFGRLGLMREPALPRLLVEFVPAAHGHQRELSVIVDPRRGLMRLLEAADRVGAVGIGPAVAHPARLGRPEVHAPRQRNGRIGVARRERIVGLRAHQRRHVIHGRQQLFVRLRRRGACGREKSQGGRRCESFHVGQSF